jgi:Fur family transcriptional regulator, ferric uptake regulator
MSSALDRLKKSGYKLTKARQAVLHALEAAGGHLTSTEVLDQVTSAAPGIGRASVFRTLDLLTRLNIIRPTYGQSSITPTYVLMPDGHHHHMICIVCNRFIEIEECGLEAMARHLEAEMGVKMLGHLLEFYGRCERCLDAPLPVLDEA